MVLDSILMEVVNRQKAALPEKEIGVKRQLSLSLASLGSHALIISGIRRCGKSTLLLQLMDGIEAPFFYLNFEDPLLFDYELQDSIRLDKIIKESGAKVLFFDEIQFIKGWELYIRQKLDENYKVIVTGSNASLLSQELGTKLTGRHITKELFPFSFDEYLTIKKIDRSVDSLASYMETGGFPEYVKTGDTDQIATLFEDILIRDITVRFGIKDVKSLQRLTLYLLDNIGNRITASKLRQPLSISATSTIMSWFSFLEQSYLLSFIPQFSHSTKAQLINPRKIYVIDTGILSVLTHTMTKDVGRKLENLVFIHLRRQYRDLFYFDDHGECDFVAIKNGRAEQLVQVCYELDSINMNRELNGLKSAMQFFGLDKGIIITFNQRDSLLAEQGKIEIIPAWQYMQFSESM